MIVNVVSLLHWILNVFCTLFPCNKYKHIWEFTSLLVFFHSVERIVTDLSLGQTNRFHGFLRMA